MTKKVSPDGKKRIEDGPTNSRKCRDLLCLLLFIANIGVMCFIAYYAFKLGNIDQIYYGTDSYGNICGVDNSKLVSGSVVNSTNGLDLRNATLLYFFNPLSPSSPKACVASCPTDTSLTNLTNFICLPGTSTPTTLVNLTLLVSEKQCAFGTIQSKNIANRCIPSDTNFVNFALNDTSLSDLSSSYSFLSSSSGMALAALRDIQAIWTDIVISIAISLLIALVWIFLLRFTASFIIWSMLLLVNAGLIGITVYLYFEWQTYVTRVANDTTNSSTLLWTRNAFLGFFIFSATIAAFVLLMVIALRKRVKIAIILIKEASLSVLALPTLILVPIVIFVLLVGLIALYLAGVLYLYTCSSNEVNLTSYSDLSFLSSASVSTGYQLSFIFQWVWLFGFFWSFFFLQAVNQTTIAGSVATWYFSRDKRAIPHFTVARSFYRCFRYHLGSLAFGSLILAIIYFIRVVLVYLERNLKSAKSRLAKFIFACLQCLFACLARFLSFLNKNAFIEIAINGYSFCKGARSAFSLLVRNALRLVAIDTVSGLILFFSKLLVASCSCFYLYLRIDSNYSSSTSTITYPLVPVIIVFIVSYWVTGLFLYIYEMAIDTIFICFCEDCDRNEETGDYFMSDRLKSLVDKHTVRNKDEN